MYVPQLLDKLPLAPNIEIIISWLPKWLFALRDAQLSRDDLLQHLQGQRKGPPLRFTNEETDILGHDHITDNIESIPSSHSFEGNDKLVASPFGSEQNMAMIAAERNEMQFASLLITLQSPGHEARL